MGDPAETIRSITLIMRVVGPCFPGAVAPTSGDLHPAFIIRGESVRASRFVQK